MMKSTDVHVSNVSQALQSKWVILLPARDIV